ncbi:MAG TPA: DNA replication protein DnaC [Lachnospiraceae bacterium]|nr:DNA replication protein DnaC [Lachnospiraceae bacterium]
MSLSNARYDAIMRKYDDTRIHNAKIRKARIDEVESRLPEYGELSRSISELSFELGLKALSGDKDALNELKRELSRLTGEKKRVLVRGGFPADYLEPLYTCPDCMDTGYRDGKKCHCFKQAEIAELYRQSNISELLNTENFSTLSYDYYNDDELPLMKNIIGACHAFVDEFDKKYDNLMFFGAPGAGKTFLTNCITKELLDSGHSVIYFTSTELFDTLATYIFRNNDASEDIIRVHEDIFSCDLLIIDDLGTETTNSFVVNQLFLIINERNIRKRSTLISTNLAMNDLSERYDDRCVSRIIGNYRFLNPRIGDLRFRIKKYGREVENAKTRGKA